MSVIAALSLFIAAEAVVVISDFGAGPVPPDIFVGGHLLAVDKDFHPLVVQTVWLAQIQHVEAHLAAENIRSAEKEPLSMPRRIYIILKEQEIIVRAGFDSSGQVSRFKSALKNDRRIVSSLAHVVRVDIHLDKLLLLWGFPAFLFVFVYLLH